MSSNMERVAAMPDASLYVNRDGRRADDCVDSMVEEIWPRSQDPVSGAKSFMTPTPQRPYLLGSPQPTYVQLAK